MNKELLGNIIKSRRLELNLSQRRLASLMKCDVKTISEIENGIRKKPKIKALEKLSKYLLIDMDELLETTGHFDEYDYEYETKVNTDIKEVPFKYVLSIVGRGVYEDEWQDNIEHEIATDITDRLIDTIGYSEEWDEILENCDNYIELSKNKRRKYNK